MSDEQMQVGHRQHSRAVEGGEKGLVGTLSRATPAEWVQAQAKDEARVQAARKRLIEAGLDADKAKQFPAQYSDPARSIKLAGIRHPVSMRRPK